jgi:hypothetical protein
MKEKEINLLGIRPNGITLCHTDYYKGKISVIMEAITEEQETRIDKSKIYYGDIRYVRNDGTVIQAKNIYLYGEVDFNNKDDISNIERFNLIDEDGGIIYSNFNYDKGHFITIDRIAKSFPTWNPVLWFKYCHCLIGKPTRIIVYRNPKFIKK